MRDEKNLFFGEVQLAIDLLVVTSALRAIQVLLRHLELPH
jgi:hypothetical protein